MPTSFLAPISQHPPIHRPPPHVRPTPCSSSSSPASSGQLKVRIPGQAVSPLLSSLNAVASIRHAALGGRVALLGLPLGVDGALGDAGEVAVGAGALEAGVLHEGAALGREAALGLGCRWMMERGRGLEVRVRRQLLRLAGQQQRGHAGRRRRLVGREARVHVLVVRRAGARLVPRLGLLVGGRGQLGDAGWVGVAEARSAGGYSGRALASGVVGAPSGAGGDVDLRGSKGRLR